MPHHERTTAMGEWTPLEANSDLSKQSKGRDSPLPKERNEAHSRITQSEIKNHECAMSVASQDTWPKIVLAKRKEKESKLPRKQRSIMRNVIAQNVRPLKCGSIALVSPPMQQNQLAHTKPNRKGSNQASPLKGEYGLQDKKLEFYSIQEQLAET